MNIYTFYITIKGEIITMKIITIVSQKGGVAKTTTTEEICSVLGQKYNVLGIDFDGQQNLSNYTGALQMAEYNAYDVFEGDVSLSDAVVHVKEDFYLNKTAVAKHVQALKESKKNSEGLQEELKKIRRKRYIQKVKDGGYDILCASKKFADAAKIYTEPTDIFLLRDLLHMNEDKYDYVVIDNAPARSPLLYMCLVASDYFIIPADRESASLDGIGQFVVDFNKIKSSMNVNSKILGVFMVREERQAVQALLEEEMRAKIKEYGIELFNTGTKNSPIPKEARLLKQSISSYKPSNKAAIEYFDFVNEILNKIGEKPL